MENNKEVNPNENSLSMEDKTDSRTIVEVGLFVTSNVSLSHLLFNDELKTPCGLIYQHLDTRHPNSETRWYMPIGEFKPWVSENRQYIDKGYRLCKRCLKAYDKLIKIAPSTTSL